MSIEEESRRVWFQMADDCAAQIFKVVQGDVRALETLREASARLLSMPRLA